MTLKKISGKREVLNIAQ